ARGPLARRTRSDCASQPTRTGAGTHPSGQRLPAYRRSQPAFDARHRLAVAQTGAAPNDAVARYFERLLLALRGRFERRTRAVGVHAGWSPVRSAQGSLCGAPAGATRAVVGRQAPNTPG